MFIDVHRITNLIEYKHYYGVRSSKISPVLGINYFSSSSFPNRKTKENI